MNPASPPPPIVFVLTNPDRQASYYCNEQLGQGGFGEVWGGFTDGGLPIAVKLWRPTSDPARDLSGWRNEQHLYLKCLHHPYIISTYDQFISPENLLVIVMERAAGSLESLVESIGPANPAYVASVGIQLCSALEHIHSMNVIHRDLTARNVLWFANNVVKLADFGISKELPTGDDFARTLIGLPGAIPPELLTQGRSTAQSDIYQLGLVLLHLLMGRAPIPSTTPNEISLQMILAGVPRQHAEALVQQHGNLAEIIAMMLRRSVDWRYQTPGQVRTDLQQEINRLQLVEQYAAQLAPWHQRGLAPASFKPRK
jgi:serine/threonine protein kinase